MCERCAKTHRCPKCGWTGRGYDARLEEYDDGEGNDCYQHLCPVCKDDVPTEIIEAFQVDGLAFVEDAVGHNQWNAREGDTNFTLRPLVTGWCCTARSTRWSNYALSIEGADRDGCVQTCREAARNFSVSRQRSP